MKKTRKVFLAADLGASGGRIMAGCFDGRRIEIDSIHRFANGGVRSGNHLHWNVLGLWHEIIVGLRAAAKTHGTSVTSIGVDTWGVDFGLLARGDELLGNPVHYRDERTTGMMEQVFQIVSRDEIFAQTGLQFMPMNTLYQLFAMRKHQSAILDAAETFLMIPDLLHFFMTGVKTVERSNASTTQIYNPQTRCWTKPLIDQLALPGHIFGDIVDAGTCLGPLRSSVAMQTGLNHLDVVLPGTHDTASAVMAVPASSIPSDAPDWCYISSGTWSLMGIETLHPIINETCSTLNFTNEGGVEGTIRLLKNIAGLWLLQECQRIWSLQGRDHGWETLVRMAEPSTPFASLIDPDHPSFVAPENMPHQIRAFCEINGQATPQSEGSFIRCAMESLALRYRQVLENLESLAAVSIKTIHIVGGGTQNQLLCQMTADACQREVRAGPVEATAIGNLMMQAVASGDISSIAEARKIIGSSFKIQCYEPKDRDSWDEAFSRFEDLSGP